MSYDALVWLLVGLGAGVAGSLMLLMGYAGLERARLGRRLRNGARAAVVVVPEGKPAPTARPPGSRLDLTGLVTAKPAPDEAKPSPVRPALVVVASTVPEPVVVVPVAKAADAEVAPPAAAPAPKPAAPAAPAAPKPVQSVEALFAEAFANDKLPAPEPDEKSR